MPRYKRKPKPPYVPKQLLAAPAVPSVPAPEEERQTAIPGTSSEAPHVPLPKRVPARYKKTPMEKPPVKEAVASPGHLHGEARRTSVKSAPDKAKQVPAKSVSGAGTSKKKPAGTRVGLLHAKQALADTAPVHGNPRRKVPESVTEPSPEWAGEYDVLKRRDTAPFTLPALIFEKETVPEEWSGRASDNIPVTPVRPLSGEYIPPVRDFEQNAALATDISRHKIRRSLTALAILVLSALLLSFGIWYSVSGIHEYRVSHTITVKGNTYPTDLKALDLSGISLSDEEIRSLSKMHNLTSLNVSRTNITSLDCISRLPLLEKLEIRDCPGIYDLTPLKKLGNITALDISGCTGITDIRPLASLTGLTALDMNRCAQIMDLTPLSQLAGLTSLGLAGLSYQPDLEILSGMTGLRNLNIGGTDVGNLDVLSDFMNLGKLQLRINSASNLSALESTVNLTTLNVDLSRYDVTDLKLLSNFPKLEEFTLTGDNKIRDIGELSLHPYLTSLVIEDAGGIPDLSTLSKLKSLKTLVLSRCYRIDDIGALKGLGALEKLSLSQGRFTDLSPVSGLKALTDLEITNTPVTDISALWDLRQLEKLSLESTDISEINVLKNLSYLKELNLRGTEVKDISVVSGFTNLVLLNIGEDRIENFNAISGLLKLTAFYASGSNFTNTVYLSRLSGLVELDLSDTNIRDIGGLSVLKNLESLDLSGTATADISPLSELAYLRSLNLENTRVTDLKTVALLDRLMDLNAGTGTGIPSASILNVIKELRSLFVLNLDTSADRSGIVSNLKVTRPRLVIHLVENPA